MPKDPHTTLKFPKVRPLEAPTQTPSPLGEIDVRVRSPSRPSAPNDFDDEVPTERGANISLAEPAIAARPDRPLLTVLSGLNPGQVFTLDKTETLIGRARDADVRFDDAGISRRHARILWVDDERHVLEDLGSANGVFVNGRRVERVDLVSGDRLQIGPALVLRFGVIAADEEALARRLYEGSTRDALTRLYNRKYVGERLATEVAYAHRHGTRLSVVLFDLDHFKRINDRYGHMAGDVVLRVVAAQVEKAIRVEDVLARYGGEEFVVLVRGVERDGVHVLANRIRVGVERLSIPWESRTLKVTVSVGVALLHECGNRATVDELVALADERLYRAKTGGRNRVC